MAPAFRQRSFVRLDQVRLADRGHGLQLSQASGPSSQPELADAGPHCTAADHNRLTSGIGDAAELLAEFFNSPAVQSGVGAGEHSGADFNDHRFDRLHDFQTARINSFVGGNIGHLENMD